jgi:N-acetyl-gamma-glutamyl-phosphate reductase
MDSLKIGVIGASGYTGGELVRLLINHPKVEIVLLSADRQKGKFIEEVFPGFRGLRLPKLEPLDLSSLSQRVDLCFLALPHKTSMEVAKVLIQDGKRVIDLSADFRLKDARLYERWYGVHSCPELLKESVYGLPELYRSKIRTARLVANPGCYPTSVLLGLLPLAEKRLIEGRIIADSKSGVSGAGRSLREDLMFTEVAESFRAYQVLEHRHLPEMEQELENLLGEKPQLDFVPHLLPINRGILSTLYVNLKVRMSEKDLYELYLERFSEEPFVRVLEPGSFPSTSQVRGSNFCDIGFKVKEKRAVIITAIDNLIKGASGQAVQNLNIMMGWPETTGLTSLPLFP